MNEDGMWDVRRERRKERKIENLRSPDGERSGIERMRCELRKGVDDEREGKEDRKSVKTA